MRYKKLFLVFIVLVVMLTNVSGQVFSSGSIERVGGTYDTMGFAGGKVVLDGSYTEPLMVFGGDVVLEGSFERKVNVYGGNVELNGDFQDDVKVYGGKVVAGEDSLFLQSLNVTSGSFVFEGSSQDSLNIFSPYAELSEGSTVSGDVFYTADDFENRGDVEGKVERMLYEPDEDVETVSRGGIFSRANKILFGFGYKFLIGAVMLALFPVFFTESAERVSEEWYGSGLIGILSLLLIPVVALGLMITLIGIPLGMIVFGIFIVSVIVGFVTGAFELGRIVLEMMDFDNRWIALATGLFVSMIGVNVPVLGMFFKMVLVALGMGGLYRSVYSRYHRG